MSSEFTCEVVRKFLPGQFLEFDINVLKVILSIQRFFNLTEYRKVIIINSLAAHYACRDARLNLILVVAMTKGFNFQIINSLMES